MAHFIQISDIHIGEQCGGSPSLAKFHTVFAGGFGHDGPACQATRTCFAEEIEDALLNNRELARQYPPRLVVTGDITSCGGNHQFAAAGVFLEGSRNPELNGGQVGLGELNWRDRGIGGNHDHWGGQSLLYSTNRIPNLYSPTRLGTFPRTTVTQVNVGGRVIDVCFIMIDTDAQSRSGHHATARGRFERQFNDENIAWLQTTRRRKNEIRVTLMHHSPSHGWGGGITDNSRDALGTLIDKADVGVILCGHTHNPRITLYTDNGRHRVVLEVCCGTTTQRSRVPSGNSIALLQNLRLYNTLRTHCYARWPADPVADPNFPLCANALVKHTLEDRDGEIYWVAETFFLNDAGTFQSHTILADDVWKRGIRYSGLYQEELRVL